MLFIKIYNKLKTLGFKRVGELVYNKFTYSFYYYLNKRRVKYKKRLGLSANYSWLEVSKSLSLNNNFEIFWESYLSKNNNRSLPEPAYPSIHPSTLSATSGTRDERESDFQKKPNSFYDNLINKIISDYNIKNLNNTYILSCANKALKSKNSWHQDSNNFNFDSTKFYKDIKIKVNTNQDIGPDIRTLWEHNRFNGLFFLGAGYKISQENKFPQKFHDDITSWLENNPYLYGPNWVCAMEVGIRSLNWILGFMFFKDIKFDNKFWEKFICSLYDHMIYLERNFEIYDTRTNNHYLSDLLGYYYLLLFFDNLGSKKLKSKITWVKKEFLKELDKQILPDGSSYEGSTAYHNLVCEIVYYFKILNEQEDLKNIYNNLLDKKFKKMCEFAGFLYLDNPDFINTNFITIGDDDSGKIVAGLPNKFFKVTKFNKLPEIKKFNNFGVSVYKSHNINLTFRTHVYNNLQPSAHFHNDFLSLTLAVNNTPVIIDPGSYVYTASSYWRNYFRSSEAHNSFYIQGLEPVKLDDNLFGLEIPLKTFKPNFAENFTTSPFTSSHELYKNLGLRATRKIDIENLNQEDKSIIITDSWENINKTNLENIDNLTTTWNLIFHPEITLIKLGDNSCDLLNNNKKLANISSQDISFKIIPGWASLNYGEKIATNRLVAQSPLNLRNYSWKISLYI